MKNWKKEFDKKFLIDIVYNKEEKIDQVCMKNNKGNCDFVKRKDLINFIENLLDEKDKEIKEKKPKHISPYGQGYSQALEDMEKKNTAEINKYFKVLRKLNKKL